MDSTKPRRRKTAVAMTTKKVKASILMDVETHRRWIVAASLSGRKREDIALDAIRDACSWVVISDRRKLDVPVEITDRAIEVENITAPVEIAA